MIGTRELGYALLRKPAKPAALRAMIAQLGRKPAGTAIIGVEPLG